MNKVSIIGIGKLGLCLALNLADKGFEIMGYDINRRYVDKLKSKQFDSDEPSVNDLLNKLNLNFSLDLEETINYSEIIFLMVDTPSLPNSKYDHSKIDDILEEFKKLGYQKHEKILVIGCTTFPGYCESLVEKMKPYNITIVYSPEFISQGNIIHEQKNPDIVLIGENNIEDGNKIESIYNTLCDNKPQIYRMKLTEAELTKLSINCFITTKISFANMIGDLCTKLGIDNNVVLKAIGSDTRIGNKYLNWGYGFGGPCFPRDNKALVALSKENDIYPSIALASDEYNNLHLKYYANFLKRKSAENNITIDGVSYKKNTTIIEESQQLKTALQLQQQGYKVTIIDTEKVINKVKEMYGEIFIYKIKKTEQE